MAKDPGTGLSENFNAQVKELPIAKQEWARELKYTLWTIQHDAAEDTRRMICKLRAETEDPALVEIMGKALDFFDDGKMQKVTSQLLQAASAVVSGGGASEPPVRLPYKPGLLDQNWAKLGEMLHRGPETRFTGHYPRKSGL